MQLRQKLFSSYFLLAVAGVSANEAVELSTIEVRAQVENLEGIASSGSEGVVSGQRLAAVPLQRPGEVLEMVPGLIVTQHAGDGNDIEYWYDSQLPNESAPVFDRHIHPAEPRTIRLTFSHRF